MIYILYSQIASFHKESDFVKAEMLFWSVELFAQFIHNSFHCHTWIHSYPSRDRRKTEDKFPFLLRVVSFYDFRTLNLAAIIWFSIVINRRRSSSEAFPLFWRKTDCEKWWDMIVYWKDSLSSCQFKENILSTMHGKSI